MFDLPMNAQGEFRQQRFSELVKIGSARVHEEILICAKKVYLPTASLHRERLHMREGPSSRHL